MGVLDEHWCSSCKKDLDKKKDSYTEINKVNPSKESKKKGLHTRVFLCDECLKEKGIDGKIDDLRKHGNPNFAIKVSCASSDICPDYTAKNKKVNCKHIYVLNEKVYCGRRHPGSVKLNQDKAMIDQETQKKTADFFKTFFTAMIPGRTEKEIDDILSLSCGSLGIKNRVSPDLLALIPDEEIIVDKKMVRKHRD